MDSLWSTHGGTKTGEVTLAKADQTVISMLYSTEKKEWIDLAYAEFQKVHPEIKIELSATGSLAAADSILEGTAKPTLFSPADTLVLNLLASDWDAKYHGSPYAPGDTADPLLITPLVFCAWSDRGQVLEAASGGHIGWKAIHDAASDNRGWPAVGGKAEWGFVKLGHTDPTRSNSGLQALTLMTMHYCAKASRTFCAASLIYVPHEDSAKHIEAFSFG